MIDYTERRKNSSASSIIKPEQSLQNFPSALKKKVTPRHIALTPRRWWTMDVLLAGLVQTRQTRGCTNMIRCRRERGGHKTRVSPKKSIGTSECPLRWRSARWNLSNLRGRKCTVSVQSVAQKSRGYESRLWPMSEIREWSRGFNV